MVIDLRKLERTIKIELKMTGRNVSSIDSFVDCLVEDIQKILRQKEPPEGLEGEIVLE